MPRYTMKQIEQVLRESKGMVFLASRQLGCSYNTIRAWVQRSPYLKALCEMEDGAVTDTAELKLYQAILNGEAWAIQYRLSRKGKDRGYGERIEVANPPGEALKFKHEFEDTIPDRLARYGDLIETIVAERLLLEAGSNGHSQPLDSTQPDG